MTDDRKTGHRKRLRNLYMNGGNNSMSNENIIELMLFYAIKRSDTKPLSYNLLNEFDGDLKALFSADAKELLKVDGMGEAAAQTVKLFGETVKRVFCSDKPAKASISGSGLLQIKAHAEEYFFNKKAPRLDFILLDNSQSPIDGAVFCVGRAAVSSTELKELVKNAVSKSAAYVIALKNCEDDCFPRSADVELAKATKEQLSSVGISFIDYILVHGDSSFSMSADFEYCNIFGTPE